MTKNPTLDEVLDFADTLHNTPAAVARREAAFRRSGDFPCCEACGRSLEKNWRNGWENDSTLHLEDPEGGSVILGPTCAKRFLAWKKTNEPV